MNNLIIKTSLKVGLVTAIAVLLYECTSVLAFCKYIKLDYYMAIMVIAALTTGIIIANTKAATNDLIQTNAFAKLTHKEMQILLLIAAGKTNKEIAAINFVEISTVKTHINHIYAKLMISSRKEVVEFCRLQCLHAKSTQYPPAAI